MRFKRGGFSRKYVLTFVTNARVAGTSTASDCVRRAGRETKGFSFFIHYRQYNERILEFLVLLWRGWMHVLTTAAISPGENVVFWRSPCTRKTLSYTNVYIYIKPARVDTVHTMCVRKPRGVRVLDPETFYCYIFLLLYIRMYV